MEKTLLTVQVTVTTLMQIFNTVLDLFVTLTSVMVKADHF